MFLMITELFLTKTPYSWLYVKYSE